MDLNGVRELRRARPYRSKRLRPCDICRQRKHACRLQDDPPCASCRSLGLACTFNNPPSKRRQRDNPSVFHEAGQDTMMQDVFNLQDSALPDYFSEIGADLDFFHDVQLPQLSHQGFLRTASPLPARNVLCPPANGESLRSPQTLPSTATPLAPGNVDALPSTSFPSLSTAREPYRASTPDNGRATTARDLNSQALRALPSQTGQSLDGTAGHSMQYFGLSGDMDPYLLRHFQFPDAGTTKFFKVHYRQLASETANDIPVHFRLAAHEPADSSASRSSADALSSRQELLESLVPAQVGIRLVGLFFRYAFPSLPILSRTAFKLTTDTLIPDVHVLQEMPSHLLAAIYASSHVFFRHDPVLSVFTTYQNLPVDKLWCLAYEGVHEDIQRAQLATIQTALLCLHKVPGSEVESLADTPFHQSWISLSASLATSLGLNLDCHRWPIPPWEKRLRRRLWWAVYTETTWHSLLAGFPHPISDDQWDVSPLDENDFVIDRLVLPNLESYNTDCAPQTPCAYCHEGYDFVFLCSLTVIAYDVYRNLYTLRATRKLAQDLESSFDVANPLLERVHQWEASLPPQLKVDSVVRPPDKCYFHVSSAAYLKAACLTLNVLIYRALMRPWGGTSTSATERPGDSQTGPTATSGAENHIDTKSPDTDGIVRSSSISCVNRVLEFMKRLNALDRISFWSSWSWMCFPSISTFITQLVVQSPTTESANQAKYLLDMWSQTLRLQCAVFDQMCVGLLRLDTMVYFGLNRLFRCPPYLLKVFRDPIDGLPVSPANPE